MLIQSENQNNIRHKLSTYINITQVETKALSFSVQGAKMSETSSLQDSDIDLRPLTDLQGEGFPLDGSCQWYDGTVQASSVTGKVGIRSHVGQSFTLSVSSSGEINALTLRAFGQGTVTVGAETYSVSEFMVIPVGTNRTSLTFTPSEGARIEVEDIQSGIVLTFNDDNLISCNLDLASDLSLLNGDWQVSSIEVQGYYPYDISEAVSNMGDGVPIIYQSGYADDMSQPRRFYVSEEVTQKHGVITIRGVDASARFENQIQPEALWTTTIQKCRQDIYKKMATWIKNAHITLTSRESNPPVTGTNKMTTSVILKEASPKDHIQNLMTICDSNNFYPRFIDGGIPTLRWSRPTSKWTIREEDVGDYELEVSRQLNRIQGADKETPLVCYLERDSKKSTIASRRITKGKTVSISYDSNYYDSVTWDTSLASLEKQTLHSLELKAKKTTQSVKYKVQSGWSTKKKRYKIGAVPTKIKKAKGYKVVTKTKNYVTVQWKEKKYKTLTKYVPTLVVKGHKVSFDDWMPHHNVESTNRLGVTGVVEPRMIGVLMAYYNSIYTIPDYRWALFKSNIKGSFTWKGNPHIQPRDVFTFVRLDGTEELCTIERIETTHSEGGMSSKITYRKGVF